MVSLTASLKKCQTYLRVGQILEILKTRFHIIHLEHQQSSAEVSDVEGGYYYLTVRDGKLQDVIYDVDTVFGYDLSLMTPVNFIDGSIEGVLSKEQCFANKVPCGFTPFKEVVEPGKELAFDTMMGFAGSTEQINAKLDTFCGKDYLANKFVEAEELVDSFTSDVKTHTAAGKFLTNTLNSVT